MPNRPSPIMLNLSGTPPHCPRKPTTASRHDVTWTDDYAWLRAENWQEVLRDPATLPADIRSYLEAENSYAASVLAPTAGLQKQLLQELRGRIKEDDASVPDPEEGWEYYSRYRLKDAAKGEGEYALECRRRIGSDAEEILLDGDARAAFLNRDKGDEGFYDLNCLATSPGQHKLLWSEDAQGSEFYQIYCRELGHGLPDPTLADAKPLVEKTDGVMVWDAAGQGFFYLRLTDNHQPDGVYYHALANQGPDPCIYREADQTLFVSLSETLDRKLLVIDCHDHAMSEARVVDLRTPLAQPVVVVPRRPGVIYSITHHPAFPPKFDGEAAAGWDADPAGTLFILTNAAEKPGSELAGDRWLGAVPSTLLPLADWTPVKPVVPYRPGRLIRDFSVRRHWLVWRGMHAARPQLCFIALAKLALGSVEPTVLTLPEAAYDLDFDEGREFDTTTLRYRYTSLTTPAEVWDLDLATGANHSEAILRKRQEIPSGHTPADYVTERRWATAPDGTHVPISLVYQQGRLNGGPLYLSGYGAYGHIRPARFSAMALSLLDRGWAYAIAHVRGGRELGEAWYQQGKLAHKENTFSDFIACAEALVADGTTADGKILAQGGSAGGMLMGAVANRARPGLLGGIIADVPFVDVLTTMLDETLPLTPPEWLEWGDPVHDATVFTRLRGYSPYDNVTTAAYPPLLVQAGLTDPRVTYWEPAKWVAKLRAKKTDANPLLLITNMGAGHGGASGRFDALKELARELAFALAVIPS